MNFSPPSFNRRNGSTARTSSQRTSRQQQQQPSQHQRQQAQPQQQQQHRQEPNLESSNLYEILGVPKNATSQQIKISYRKLALQHHPDRLSPEASTREKEGAHKNFTKIGHAYEILGDESRRREYDAEQEQEQQYSRRDHGGMDPFDSFFSSFGSRNSRRSAHHSRFDEFHFMDPFELFNQFFSDENEVMNGRRQNNGSSQSRSAFNDPFFGNDPFFSGFGRSNMVSRHFDMMNGMNSMMAEMHSTSMNGSRGMNGSSQTFFSSSSNRGGSGSVSTSTRTTIVNGVRTTVTERTVVHPDGRVERHVETSGGQNAALPATNRPAIEYDDRRERRR